MIYLGRLMAVAALGLSLPALSACREPEFMAQQVTACDLAKDPGKFEGHLVHITGAYISDGLGITGFMDNACPGVFVHVTDDEAVDKNYEYNTLDQEAEQAQGGKKGIPSWDVEAFGAYNQALKPNGEILLTRVAAFHRVADRLR